MPCLERDRVGCEGRMALEGWIDIGWKQGVGKDTTKGLESHNKKYCPYPIHQWILSLSGYWNYLEELCKNTNPRPLPTHVNFISHSNG